MSRDFLSSENRDFLRSPNRDRITRGTEIALTVGIYRVEITTIAPNGGFPPYPDYDLGSQIYSRAVAESGYLAGLPYPSSPGKNTHHLNLSTGAYEVRTSTSSPLIVLNTAGDIVNQLFLAFAAMELSRGRFLPSSPFSSGIVLSKVKIVFNRSAYRPFCLYQTNAFPVLQPNGVYTITAHDTDCFRSRVTGDDSDPAHMYSATGATVEFGPHIPDQAESPSAAMDLLNSPPIGHPGGYFGTFRKIAGSVYDRNGIKYLLRTPVLGLGETDDPAPCCDLS